MFTNVEMIYESGELIISSKGNRDIVLNDNAAISSSVKKMDLDIDTTDSLLSGELIIKILPTYLIKALLHCTK